MGAIPKRCEDRAEVFVLSTKITEPEAPPAMDALTLTAIPETPDPFGLHVSTDGL